MQTFYLITSDQLPGHYLSIFRSCAWEIPFEEQLLDITGRGGPQNIMLSNGNAKSSGPGLLVHGILKGWTCQPWVLECIYPGPPHICAHSWVR